MGPVSTELKLGPRDQVSGIMMVGLQGSGKTTTAGKLASYLLKQGRKPLLVAADIYRPAAVDQLKVLGERIQVPVFHEPGLAPPVLAERGYAYAREQKRDVVIIDTAGRLHNKSHLMQELAKIHRVIEKELPGAPHETLLVIDGTTGQNGVSQAAAFLEAAKVTGMVVTKLDGTAKGGVILSIMRQFDIPVKFVGVGRRRTTSSLSIPRHT
jgi:signal recognition particle subunit SRP54